MQNTTFTLKKRRSCFKPNSTLEQLQRFSAVAPNNFRRKQSLVESVERNGGQLFPQRDHFNVGRTFSLHNETESCIWRNLPVTIDSLKVSGYSFRLWVHKEIVWSPEGLDMRTVTIGDC